ncbi:MAG: hypothetical protein QM733_18690 [Ilumatobacteraceae bacterium]
MWASFDHCLDDRLVGRHRPEPGDEAAIDLHRGDRQLAQVGERRVAGAEVVEGDLDAEPAQAGEAVDGAVEVGQDRGLGDLEADLVRAEGLVGDRRLDPPQDLVGAGHLMGAEVDPHPQRAVALARAQAVQRLEDPVEHPLPDVGHEAGGFGDGQELVGQQQPPGAARPAHEGLEGDDAVVTKVDHRLEVGAQVALGDRLLQFGLEPLGAVDLAAELLAVLGRRRPLLLLGGPVCALGVVEQFQAGLARGGGGIPAADVEAQLDRPEVDRLADRGHQPRRDLLDLRRRGAEDEGGERRAGVGQQRVGRGGAQRPAHDERQRAVADAGAPALVDVVEADDVEMDHPGGALAAHQLAAERGSRHQCRRALLGNWFGGGN